MSGQVQVEISSIDRTQQGIQSAEKRLKGMSDNAQQSLKSIAGAAQAASGALAGLGAGAAFNQLVQGVNTTVDAYNRLRASQVGVSTVADRMGQSLSGVNKLVSDLTGDGLINQADAAAAVKNFLSINASIDDTRKVLLGAKDAAAFNRQETFSLSEAVRRFSEGVKNGNSAVSDSAGIQKNLTTILKERGFSEQDLSRVQSDAAVRQALLNGLVQESAIYQGDASRLAGELAGSQARASAEAEKLKASLGAALAPAVAVVNEESAQWTKTLRIWTEVNPQAARSLASVAGGLLGGAAAATAAAGAITVVTVAVRGLVAATGPVGIVLSILTAVAGAWAGVELASRASTHADSEHAQQTFDLMRRYEGLRKIVDDTTTSEGDKARAQERLKDVTQQLIDLQPTLQSAFDTEGRLLDTQKGKYGELRDAVLEVTRAKLNLQVMAAEDQLKGLDKQLEDKPMKSAIQDRRTLADSQRADLLKGIERAKALGYPESFIKDREDQIAQIDANLVAVDKKEQDVANAPARRKLEAERALAKAELDAARKALEQINNPLPPEKVNPPPPAATGTGGTGGGKEMSAGLKAAMEDLQDLQALEKTPDNLRRILAKVREVLTQHGAELQKLDKDRDLIRQRDITLPEQIAQAEYTQAMAQLDADKQLKHLTPEEFAKGLRDIKEKFASYLAAHPDLALQLDLRLKGATDEELKAPLEAQREAMRTIESMGGFDGTGGIERKLLMLRQALNLALGAGDQNAVAEFTGQIKQVERAISEANFTEKFDRIKKAKDEALAAAAGLTTSLEKQLIDEEAKGDKADPQRIAALKQQMLDAVKPALEAEQAALQAIRESVLADKTISEEERARRVEQIDQDLNQVRADLYRQDVDAHRIATESKTAAEKEAAKQRTKLQKDALTELDKAEKKALDEFKAGAKEREDAIDAEIKAKEEQLKQLDQQYQQEDRLRKLQDDQKRIDDLKHSGARQDVITGFGPDGKPIYDNRIVGMDEAQKRLEDDKRETERARRKEALQGEINDLRDGLQALRDSNKEKEAEIQAHFAAAKDAVQKGFEEMDAAQGTGLDTMKTNLVAQVDGLLGEWARYAQEAKRIINSIPNGGEPPAAGAPAATPTPPSTDSRGGATAPNSYTRGKQRAFATGAYLPGGNPFFAMVNDVEEWYTPARHVPSLARAIAHQINWIPPKLPADLARASAGGAQGAAPVFHIEVNMPPGMANPAEVRAAARAGVEAAVDPIKNMRIGFGQGQASG